MRISPRVKLKYKRTKCSPDIGPPHCSREVAIYLRYDFDGRKILIEQPFIPRTPLENTKEGKIKDLEDLSCMWCKSCNAHTCFSENTDPTIADISRTMSYQ
jgi:hypothetical protein